MSYQKTYLNYLSSALPALVVLLFGFFNTSAHITTTAQALPAQTELLHDQKYSIEGTSINPIVNKVTLHHFNDSERCASSYAFIAKYLIRYQSLISVKLRSQSGKLGSLHNPSSHFLQCRKIPQDSDDPFDINRRGSVRLPSANG